MKDKLPFVTRKLKGALKPITTRVRDVAGAENLTVYGVTNQEGVTLTGKAASEDVSNYIVVGPNQFVYNPYRVNVGSIGLTDAHFAGIVSPAYVVFEAGPEVVSGLLFQYLKSSIGQKLIRWYGDRGGVRSAMRFTDLINIDYPAITPEEQQAALTVFERVAIIESELQQEFEYQSTLLTRLRQTILRDAVQGRLVSQETTDEPADILLARARAEKQRLMKEKIRGNKPLPPLTETEIPYEVPKGWAWCLVEDVCSSITDCVNKTAPLAQEITPYKMLRTTNIRNGEVDTKNVRYVSEEIYQKWTARDKPLKGDLILTREAPLGEVGLVEQDDNIFLGQRLVQYRTDPKMTTEQFLFYVFRGPIMQKQIQQKVTSSHLLGRLEVEHQAF